MAGAIHDLAEPAGTAGGDLACLRPFAQAQASDYPEAISRVVSVFVGTEPSPAYREIVSREVSAFVGAEPQPPYREIVSRETSVLQPYGASYIVTGGQQLSLPMLFTYQAPDQEGDTTWLKAIGTGSVLSFPNLTNVIGNSRRDGYLRIEAVSGGRVNLGTLRTCTQTYDGNSPANARGIQILADGAGSVVDLHNLQLFQDLASTPGSRIEARNGGTILLGGGQGLALHQISLVANGSGTWLDLNALKTLEGATSASGRCDVQALAGATVDLRSLPEIGVGAVNFLADGGGSVIDLSDLVRFNGGTLEARNAGRIRTPKLLFMDRGNLIIRGSGQVSIAQLRKLTNSRVTIDGTAVEFTSLFNWTGTTFAYANGGSARFQQMDLALSSLTFNTNQFWCGEPVTVSWQGTNRTGAEVIGSWTDAIYLSADDRWDINDILLGTVDQTNGLGSNQIYTATTNFFVPGVLAGDYHVLVRSVMFGFAGTNGMDNTITQPVPVFMPELLVGVPTNSTFLAAGHARYYRLVVEEGKDLKVSLDLLATNGATELYLRQGAIPTRSVFDVKHNAPFEPKQTLRVPGTRAETVYILAYAEVLPAQPAPFEMTADYLPFALTALKPAHGGNQGHVTITLTGSGIASTTGVNLVYTNTHGIPTTLPAIRTKWKNMGEGLATFDLRGLPLTSADVVTVGATSDGGQLPQAFRIETGEPEQLQVIVAGPSNVRKGSPPSRYSVTVRNDSNQDAQLVNLTGATEDDGKVSLTVEGPELYGNRLKAEGGLMSCLYPLLAPGEVVTFTYWLQVARDYSDTGALMSWRAWTLNPSSFLAATAAGIESSRQDVLANTNLQVQAPEFYAMAQDPQAWQAAMERSLYDQGYLTLPAGSEGGKATGSSASCMGDPSTRLKGDCTKICRRICNKNCRTVITSVCQFIPPARWVCRLVSYPICDGTCQLYCEYICTPQPVDPNDIKGPIGWGTQAFLAESQPMSYTVDFENQPAATAAALQVAITNQLDAGLDWKTVEFQEIAFAGLRLAVPAGQNHYEGRLPFAGWTWNVSQGWHRGETPLMVDVKATVDTQTGLLLVALSCSDTNTGTFPADAYAGFLPPNRPETFYYATNGGCCGNTNVTSEFIQPGQGYVSYTVRPRTNVVTGTRIANAASIVFDWNDPIATPTVFNTIDAGVPVSSVLALPAESGRTFRLQWAGADDAGGSGVASYDIYVSTDATNYTRWLQATADTGAWFVGQPGLSYSFYSVARDWVGNEEPRPKFAQASTTIPKSVPVLAVVTNSSILPGSALTITNAVQGTPAGQWVFMLGEGVPAGASVNPTNGVFRWTPTCAQATTTNTFTVWVTDSGRTNLMDAMNFTVVVRECVQPILGQQVLLAGQSGHVPVWLISTVPLTNLSMTLVAPADRLGGYSLQTLVPQICTNTITPLSNDLHRLNFVACPGQSLIGTQQVAWLNFTTVSNQSSAFVRLEFTDLVGRMADGTPVANFAPQSGRVVVIGEEPLLEMIHGTNGQPLLILYGKPASGYTVESRPDLTAGAWQPALPGLAITTNLWLDFPSPGSTNRGNYYRAVRQ
jgi:hypothetical protein